MISQFKSSSPLRFTLLALLGVVLIAVTLTEIPSAALASPDIVVVGASSEAGASDLARSVAAEFARTDITPAVRASGIATMIEAADLPTPVVVEALRGEGRRLRDLGDEVVAERVLYLATFMTKDAGLGPSKEQNLTAQALRNAGTMMYQRLAVPSFGESPVREAVRFGPVLTWSECTPATHAEVQGAVGADLQLPEIDGWGRPLEFCLDLDVDEPRMRVALRSAGSDGQFAESYSTGGFPVAETGQDLVWINGYFMRWPQS